MSSSAGREARLARVEDVDALNRAVLEIHPAPFTRVDREEFAARVADVRARAPDLRPDAFIAELARLLASIRDGHTLLYLDRPARATWTDELDELPLELYLFADGLFVRRAAPSAADVVGLRVVSIGGVSAAECVRRAGALVGADNQQRRDHWAAQLLRVPAVTSALDLTDTHGQVPFTFSAREGLLHRPIGPTADRPSQDWVDARRAAPPLYLTRPDEDRWFVYLPDSAVLYVQLRTVLDGPEETLAAFAVRAAKAADAVPFRAVVLDVRMNWGGDNTLIEPMVAVLADRTRPTRDAALFVVVGRVTFSAGMNLATVIERRLPAIFVGEPTGAAPNHFGDARKVTLPHCRAQIWISTRWWEFAPGDDRHAIAPTVPTPLESGAYARGTDPALDAVLRSVAAA